MMDSLRRGVDRTLEWTLVLLVGLITLNVLWQVTTRFVFRDPSSYTEELARFLLIWVSLLGASYSARKRMHLAIDLLSRHWPPAGRRWLECFIQLCIFLFALGVMVLGGLRLVYITLSLQQISAALQVPLGYVYLVLPLSGILIMFYSACALVEELAAGRAARGKDRS